jgi:hypothetical protein
MWSLKLLSMTTLGSYLVFFARMVRSRGSTKWGFIGLGLTELGANFIKYSPTFEKLDISSCSNLEVEVAWIGDGEH